ncbi:MAG TPA: hypothetical protein VGD65_10840 [Chryseosolibacter sp.]
MATIRSIIGFLCTMLACATPAVDAIAQQGGTALSRSNSSLMVSVGPGTAAAALSWSTAYPIMRKLPGLKVGYGVRFTSFVAANKFYTTAPARFTSPVQNLGTIFSETIEANIDTITTATSFTNSVNLAIYIEYAVTPRLDAGFNIDAGGFSFGPRKQFNVISSVFDANQSPVQTGAPTRFNLLLTSDNDIGSLNSEFYARYWLKEHVGMSAGLTFLFSEYRLNKDLSFDNGRIINDRYRYKAAMLLIGFTYKMFNKFN